MFQVKSLTGFLIVFLPVLLCILLPVDLVVAGDVYVNKDTTPVTVDGQTITAVGDNSNFGTGPANPVRTITKGESIAQSDSTIYVGPGVYGETVSVQTSNVTIVGADPDRTIIRDTGLGSSASGITVENENNVTLSNFAVDNFDDVGVKGDSVSELTLRNLEVTNTNDGGGNGKGIFLVDSTEGVIEDNEVTGNQGDGIESQNSETNLFRRNLISNNNGAGVRFDNATGINFRINEVKSNDAEELSIQNNSGFESLTKNNLIAGNNDINSSITGDNIKATLNWWGSTDQIIIKAGLDPDDDFTFSPFRLSPVDTASSSSADTVAPGVPRNFTADTSVPRKVRLDWRETDNKNQDTSVNAYQIDGYRVYRSLNNSNPSDWKDDHFYREISDPNDTTFIDQNVETGDTDYYYRVTAFDSEGSNDRIENESFFTDTLKANPQDFGPSIYVNDTSTVNDVFTDAVGNDSKVGTKKNPLRTLQKAADVSEPGDSIYVDAGVYTDTSTVDTGNVTVIGAGQDKTIFDVNYSGTAIRVTQNLGPGNGNDLRNFTVRDAVDGIVYQGADASRVMNVDVRGNTTGIRFVDSNNNRVNNSFITENKLGARLQGSSSGNLLAQNQFDSNTTYQVRVDNTPNSIRRNNIVTSSTWPDSGIQNTSGASPDLTFNWWTSADSEFIRGKQSETGQYIPHRLGMVDTGVGADSVAPSQPGAPTIDTSVAQEITLRWNQPTDDEDGSSLSGTIDGYRIYRITNESDTTNWTNHLYETITTASDTDFTDSYPKIRKNKQYAYRITTYETNSNGIENESYFTEILSGTWTNRKPVADSLSINTQVDSAVKFQLSGSDSDGIDPLEFHLENLSDVNDGDSLTLPKNGILDTAPFTPSNPELIYRPDTGFAGVDTFTYVVSDTETVSDTAIVTLNVLTQTSIVARRFTAEGANSPVRAGTGGTMAVRLFLENLETGPGDLQRDTSALRIQNALGEDVTDSFNVSLSGTQGLRLDGEDTRIAEWGIDVPSKDQFDRLGNFRLYFDFNNLSVQNVQTGTRLNLGDSLTRSRRTINILPQPIKFDRSKTASGIDTVPASVQSVTLNGGVQNGDTVLKNPSLSNGDSIIRVIQRGGTGSIDTPLANPAYGFNDEDQFDADITSAYETMRNQDLGRNLDILENNLLVISIWNDTPVSGTYLGDSDTIREDMDVTVSRVNFTGKPERLKVVKLLPGSSDWTVVDELEDQGDVTGSNGNYTVRFTVPSDSSNPAAGFSVFQIIASGVVNSGDASDVVVYPNPFVPNDGDPQTGQYGSGPNQGIYFSAGNDRGFPPGTKIRIYTIKGEEIREFTLNTGGILQWDAKTQNNNPVSSGVYIYRIKTPNGNDKVGKFAIVR